MTNGYKIFAVTNHQDDDLGEAVYLSPPENEKLQAVFVNELEANIALSDNQAKGKFVILNVKEF